ncbi:beta-N-acetylhexosaminidase [Aliiglaciecola litoralis]
MLDVSSFELTAVEKDVLDHPLVGGVILFSRNYHDQQQLAELVRQIRHHSRNELLVAVDHEGGRVQRFRDSFSAIPAMGSIAANQDSITDEMRTDANTFGWLMASELLAFDIDISFAPVLDIWGISDVIGDRSFHQQPDLLIELASAFILGMRSAGMKSTGKHFPGHGNVKEDSHIAMPIDKRNKQVIFEQDMRVFSELHHKGLLDAVMPAHVIYPEVDSMPAGFSKIWVEQILRQQLAFNGVVFTDDLSMQGAAHLGSFVERAETALQAGCDMALVCNHPDAAIAVLDGLSRDYVPTGRVRSMRKTVDLGFDQLQQSVQYKNAIQRLEQFYES